MNSPNPQTIGYWDWTWSPSPHSEINPTMGLAFSGFSDANQALSDSNRIKDTLITSPVSDRILDGITRKSIIQIAEDEGIDVEVRMLTVSEVVEAAKNGSLMEMFGAGTAAVISPIAGFGFKDEDFDLPELASSYASRLKKRITDIQTNKAEDKYGWRVKV